MMSGSTSKHHDGQLVCLDDEVKNPEGKDLPVVEEGSQIKKVGPADVKHLTTSEPDEVEPAPESVDGEAEAVNLDYDTFSLTNHRFDIILSKSNFGPSHVAFLPAKTIKVLPKNKKVPVVLNSYGKSWTMFYNGNLQSKTFNCSGWRKFVTDNKLEVGDACFFELLENSTKKIVFKVVILKTAFPSRVEGVDGTSAQKPIVLAD